MSNIYVSFAKPETLEEFLRLFFNLDQQVGCGKAVKTYSDKECNEVQCAQGQWRSIEDLYDCVRTYFPGAKLTAVISTLIKQKPVRGGVYFYPYYYLDIGKCNIIWYKTAANSIPFSRGTEYEWEVIFKEMGINTIADMYNYK